MTKACAFYITFSGNIRVLCSEGRKCLRVEIEGMNFIVLMPRTTQDSGLTVIASI